MSDSLKFWYNFKCSKLAFQAKTLEDACEFFDLCIKENIQVPFGCTYKAYEFLWYTYKEETCYYLNEVDKKLHFINIGSLMDTAKVDNISLFK